MSIEAMKQALEALNYLQGIVDTERGPKAAETLRQAIEEAEKQEHGEPVAWTLLLVGEHNGIVGKAGYAFENHPEHYKRVDVYTTPQQRKPLTDEQIGMAFRKVFPVGSVVFTNGATEFARAIEAAHGIIKNYPEKDKT